VIVLSDHLRWIFKKNSIEFPVVFVKKGTGRGQRRGVMDKSILQNDVLHYFRE